MGEAMLSVEMSQRREQIQPYQVRLPGPHTLTASSVEFKSFMHDSDLPGQAPQSNEVLPPRLILSPGHFWLVWLCRRWSRCCLWPRHTWPTRMRTRPCTTPAAPGSSTPTGTSPGCCCGSSGAYIFEPGIVHRPWAWGGGVADAHSLFAAVGGDLPPGHRRVHLASLPPSLAPTSAPCSRSRSGPWARSRGTGGSGPGATASSVRRRAKQTGQRRGWLPT